MEQEEMEQIIHLLWTGGWDSTFRLLYLLLIERREVQLYYLIQSERPQLVIEIRAMEKIKEIITMRYPSTKKLIKPTIIRNMKDFTEYEEIDEMFNNLLCLTHIGWQYVGLSKFAKHYNLNELEICDVKNDCKNAIAGLIASNCEGKGHECKIKNRPDNKNLEMFKPFRFPLIYLSKLEMKYIAKEEGFYDIMKHTWYCGSPKKGNPCGKCRPCTIRKASGLEL
ncbi:7-cyano-7-deazaguanine synthase [Candidatus Woesearchaeota archaeon]|nr:7-cyano-7-deazaguanine synthase [Candidatus Woesearchaeota archaeon]